MGLFDFLKGNSDNPSIDLSDMKFISNDHIRYQNGQDVSGHNDDCWRGLRVQNNISGGQGYTVTMYNIDGNHPVWGNNIQMAPKQMKIIEQNNTGIKLRGYGTDQTGGSFADYGLTLHLNTKVVEKVTLHMHDRNIDIVYFKANSAKPQKNITVDQIEAEFSKGVNAIRIGDNVGAAKHYKQALVLKQVSDFINDDWDSCCYFNLGEAQKELKLYDEAIENYKKAINKKKLNEDAYTSLAECYFAQESTEGLKNVVTILNTCNSYFPENETAHYNIAIAHFKLRNIQKALESFIKSRNLGNTESDFYINLIQTLE